jgi:hypothetical protein
MRTDRASVGGSLGDIGDIVDHRILLVDVVGREIMVPDEDAVMPNRSARRRVTHADASASASVPLAIQSY